MGNFTVKCACWGRLSWLCGTGQGYALCLNQAKVLAGRHACLFVSVCWSRVEIPSVHSLWTLVADVGSARRRGEAVAMQSHMRETE